MEDIISWGKLSKIKIFYGIWKYSESKGNTDGLRLVVYRKLNISLQYILKRQKFGAPFGRTILSHEKKNPTLVKSWKKNTKYRNVYD